MGSIRRQFISGTFFIAIARYSSVFINIAVTAILARLIIPEHFAIVAITSVIYNFFNLFGDFGFASAIIQRQDLENKDYSNIFSISAYIGIFLSIILFFSAELLSEIYEQQILCTLVRLLTIQVLFTSLNIVPNALLTKSKEFRFIAVRTVFISILTGTCAIVYAILYQNIFSLIISPILTSIFIFTANFIKIGFLRFYIFPSWNSIKKILNYSAYSLSYNIINYMSRNLDTLIIGKFLPMRDLAFYEKSYTLMLFPIMNIISIVNPVIHPILSKYQDDRNYIYKYFNIALRLFAWIGFPVSVVLSVFSEEFIHIMLGKDWDGAIPIFRAFSLSIGFQFIYTLQGPFFLIRNLPKAMFACGLATALMNIVALMTGLFVFHSTLVIALLIDISYILSTFITFYYLYKLGFHSEFRDFCYNIFKPLLISIFYLCTLSIIQYTQQDMLANILKYGITIIFLIFSVIKIKKAFLLSK